MLTIATATTDWVLAICSVVGILITILGITAACRRRRTCETNQSLDERIVELLCRNPSGRFTVEDIAGQGRCTVVEADASLLRLLHAERIVREGIRWRCPDQKPFRSRR
jgi:hypothetical protein